MFTIEPAYYAEQVQQKAEYTLHGVNLNAIPVGSIAVFSDDNDEPLKNKDSLNSWQNGIVVESSPTVLVTSQEDVHDYQIPQYLGAILSSDRSEVLWVNNTKPLP